MNEVASPCVGICAFNAALGWCSGCGRTLDEIGAWPVADPTRKRAILADAAARSGAAWRAPLIPPVAHELSPALQTRIDDKLGQLGRLGDIALRVGLMQRSVSPVLRRPSILLFGEGMEGLAGFARPAGVEVRVEDITPDQGVGRWLMSGAAKVARLAPDGFDVMAPVAEPLPGADGLGERLCQVRAGPDAARDVLAVVALAGAHGVAMAAGAMIEATRRRMLVLVDGQAAMAALFAVRLAPGVADYMIFADRSAGDAARRALAVLDAQPVLDLGARLAPGVGAALAWPIVAASVAFLRETSTVQSLGSTHRKPLA